MTLIDNDPNVSPLSGFKKEKKRGSRRVYPLGRMASRPPPPTRG
jgi:hypothetical protein